MGRRINAEIMSSFRPYTAPKVVDYVNKIGKSLTNYAKRQELDYRFTVLYNDKIYATSAPGGYVYITTGMLYFLDNEAELAAILAHEIGHLQYKDPRLSVARRTLNAVTESGAMIAPMFGQLGMLASLGFVAVHAVTNHGELNPEKKLSQADRLGMDYMVKAGHDPQGMIDIQYKFLKADQSLIAFFFDYAESRPITMDRFKKIEAEFAKLPLAGKNFSTNHEIYKEITRGIGEIYQ